MRHHRNLLAVLFIVALAFPVSAKGSPREELVIMPVYGAQDARLTFTVWGSLTCPFTRQLIPILKQVVDESGGKANMEWRHYPVHRPDPALHVYSMADPSRFWDFLFAYIEKLGPYGANFTAVAVEAGQDVGTPTEKIRESLENDKLWNAVKQDFLAAKLAGIEVTPGLFHDGYFLTPNGMPQNLDEFKKILRNIVENAQ